LINGGTGSSHRYVPREPERAEEFNYVEMERRGEQVTQTRPRRPPHGYAYVQPEEETDETTAAGLVAARLRDEHAALVRGYTAELE
jgi:hypothetical protein